MSANNWASNAARNPEYRQQSHQQAIDIIESAMLGERVPSDAANAIAAVYEPLIKKPNTSAINIFWVILSEATRVCGSIEEHAMRLTDLIIAIQNLPALMNDAGYPVYLGGSFWKDLPGWRLAFREYGIDTDAPDDFEPEWRWREQVEPLLNATTFAATLLTRAPFLTGMLFHACTAFDCALSTSYPPGDDLEMHQYAELYLPAAATWILIAGPKLHEACKNSHESGHVVNLYPERWEEWQQRFVSIAANADFSKDGREWARQAAAYMQDFVERNS